MHIHKALLIALGTAALAGCASTTSPAAATLPAPRAIEPLCAGRERCVVTRRRAAGGVRVVADVRIAHRPHATEDADHCDRREYWLIDGSKTRLIAVDCEQQWGADNPGPADTSVAGDKMVIRYVEYGANDTCATYDGVVDTASFRIESERWMTGDVEHSKCVNQRPSQDHTEPGDGSSMRPLVTLHP
jgi:hypothetical protein